MMYKYKINGRKELIASLANNFIQTDKITKLYMYVYIYATLPNICYLRRSNHIVDNPLIRIPFKNDTCK